VIQERNEAYGLVSVKVFPLRTKRTKRYATAMLSETRRKRKAPASEPAQRVHGVAFQHHTPFFKACQIYNRHVLLSTFLQPRGSTSHEHSDPFWDKTINTEYQECSSQVLNVGILDALEGML